MRRSLTVLASLVLVTLVPLVARQAGEPVDAAANAKIRDEAMNRSKAGGMFTTLVDTIGPRLAGSPEYKRAVDWAAGELRAWGLTNVAIESFEFGRGWRLERFTIEMVEPRYMALVGYPEAWSPSTNGEMVATVQVLAGKTAEDVEALQASGALKGAAVITQPKVTNFIRTDRVNPTADGQVDPPLETAPQAAGRQGGARQGGAGRQGGGGPSQAQRIDSAVRASHPAVWLRPSRGEHGTLFVQAGRGVVEGDLLPRVVLIGEHYNMLARLAEQGETVKVRVNVHAKLLDDPNSYNVVGEIRGSDPKLANEVVMLGAHLDSWHTASGATDNADGVAAAMEALRILKTTGLTLKRTVRLGLWGAEEQGLHGSQAYVRRHLAGDANTAARDNLAVYFNIDPGKGPIYGWYMENNERARPIFDAWIAPFTDIGARRNVRQGIGNTDHLSFIRAGMLGFNPVQEYAGYDVRDHHTNVDTPERVLEPDLKQNAVILASFLYHAANRAERIPR